MRYYTKKPHPKLVLMKVELVGPFVRDVSFDCQGLRSRDSV